MYDIVKNDPNSGVNKLARNTGYIKPEKQIPFATTAPRISTAENMDRASELPGPGTYKTRTSFIKKTFNKTFH